MQNLPIQLNMGCCKVGTYTFENCEFCMTDKNLQDEHDSVFCSEELEIQTWENEIGFDHVKTRDLTDHILSICRREIISEADFIQILEVLNINRNQLSKFKRFQDKSGYSLQKIAFSGILLGRGSNEDKLFCLFSLIDLHGTSSLSKHDLIKAIKDLINLATSPSVPDSTYLASLAKLRPMAISKLIHELCIYDQCSQSQLREILATKDCWFLFSSKSLRSWIQNLNPMSQIRLTEESTGVPAAPGGGLVPVGNNGVLLNGIGNGDSGRAHLANGAALGSCLNYENGISAGRVNTESVTSSVSGVEEVLPNNVKEEVLSSSSDSNGPICLQVNLSPKEKKSFYFYANEDPVVKAMEFCKEHNLSPDYKEKLINTVTRIKHQVA